MVSYIHAECLSTGVGVGTVTIALVLMVSLTLRFFPSWPVSQSFTFTFCQWLMAVALQLVVVLGRPKYVMSTGIVYVSRRTVYRYGRSYDYTAEILSLVNST